jgi:hypothetical protein
MKHSPLALLALFSVLTVRGGSATGAAPRAAEPGPERGSAADAQNQRVQSLNQASSRSGRGGRP